MSKNIVLDFSKTDAATNANQEMAIMPASLAKRLLQTHVALLVEVPSSKIMSDQLERLTDLMHTNNYAGFMVEHIEFIQERQLIENISNENWDAYKVGE